MGPGLGLRPWRRQLLLIAPQVQAVDVPRGVAFSLPHSLQPGWVLWVAHRAPLWKGPTPFEALSPPFYGMHAGRLTRERQPLCVPMWKELQDIFFRAKYQVIEQYVKCDSIYKQQIFLKITHTHMQPYYSVFPPTDWLYPSIYDYSRVSLEIEQASLIY